MLARGEWQPHLCKKLKNVPHKLQLYEAKVSKGGRILWDVAITFSPRCNKTAEKQQEWEDSATGGKVYSEIIRIWDIVLDHDKLHRSVQQSAERIKFHNQSLQKKFFEISSIQTPTNTEHVIPQLFPEVEYLQQQKQQKYIPTADGNEHHMTKFYSFNSALVSYVLRNIDIKADFPFCVTDKEQAIITLRSNAPILLLGRSGTG
ncbi:hypothetical protein ACJMK2_001002 [Sinanodonta woodiana]|uniref:Uncharacterized protein n=1 Tax=Sinanodonta woodiana TaxID=1069815 RepID=A0ABD3XU71_SINWO